MLPSLNAYAQRFKPHYITLGYIIYGAYGLYFTAQFLIALNPPADPSQIPVGVGSIFSTLFDLIFVIIVPLIALPEFKKDRIPPKYKRGLLIIFIYPTITGLVTPIVLPLALYTLPLLYIAFSE